MRRLTIICNWWPCHFLTTIWFVVQPKKTKFHSQVVSGGSHRSISFSTSSIQQSVGIRVCSQLHSGFLHGSLSCKIQGAAQPGSPSYTKHRNFFGRDWNPVWRVDGARSGLGELSGWWMEPGCGSWGGQSAESPPAGILYATLWIFLAKSSSLCLVLMCEVTQFFDIFHPSSYMNLGKRSGYLQVKKLLFLKPFSRNTPPMILLLMRIKYGCMTGWIWNKASQGKLPDWQNGRTSNYRHTFIATERSGGT